MFYPATLVEQARNNIHKFPWAADIQKRLVAAAQPWMKFSDDKLWEFMFGNTIRRSWMVWSNGHCPGCKKDVPMYTWKMDALGRPWKTQCPHCLEFFPKNDFAAFYRSGLDERHIFDPQRADRSLLFNAEHPAPGDPLRGFGVDDGEGYVDGDKRWRFIGAYLIYGQWKHAIVSGIRNLAAAHLVTGEPQYAHKAGVLLDRVADLHPSFDFGKEGVMYERPPSAGYVSTWHDACEETRGLALAFAQIRDALEKDQSLADFLAQKAVRFRIGNPKKTPSDIVRNIEDNILRDALQNPKKIYSNYPQTQIALMTMHLILGGPENRKQADAILDTVLEKATAVDGVTGEKGLAGYTAFTIRGLATFLESRARTEGGFLRETLKRHPQLAQTYRFHIDTHCLGKYYPEAGDSGAFAQPNPEYAGLVLSRQAGIGPSMFSFLGRLYEATGDAAFIQTLYAANGHSTEGLPHDLFVEDPAPFQQMAGEVIAREGAVPKLGSVNKQQWCIAILRSGKEADARAAWLDYDAGGPHSHADGMNLGLFAKGLDLMPDFGYPPVQFGGWNSSRSLWYRRSAAHNTVVVDGRDLRGDFTAPFIEEGKTCSAKTTLWAEGVGFRVIRASAPEMIEGRQFERTIAMVDVSENDSYLVDVFRVAGGADHAKFMHSHFGRITTHGLKLAPDTDYGHNTLMRNFQTDPNPMPGWSVDWKIHDHHKLLPTGADIHLRCTDLTRGAQASTCEGWISVGGFNKTEEVWIPRLMVRRQAAQAPLATTFAAVIEPYEKTSNIAGIRRLKLQTRDGSDCSESHVAIEVLLADGRSDLIIATDVENSSVISGTRDPDGVVVQTDWGVELDGDLSLVRRGLSGAVESIILCRGRALGIGQMKLRLKSTAGFIEIRFDKHGSRVISGDPSIIQEIRL